MAIDSINQAAQSGSQSASAASRLSADYESFLKLLTAQIANQDPLEPMDSTTFVTQLAQLSQVEQSVVTNTNLESINAHLAASGAMGDMSLIGHDVTLATDLVELRGGAAEFEYQLVEQADTVTARILTEDGTLVREIKGLSGTAGGETHDVSWDGLDKDGLPVPDAVFTIEIKAETAEGDSVDAVTYAASRVEELSFEYGQPTLLLRNGGTAVSGQVISIR